MSIMATKHSRYLSRYKTMISSSTKRKILISNFGLNIHDQIQRQIGKHYFSTTKKKRRNPPPKLSKHAKSNKNSQNMITTRNSRRMQKVTNSNPLPPISKILTSPKLHRRVMDKLVHFQKETQSILLPDSLQNGRPSHEQRMAKTIVMDLKWWTWNIALACVPALLIMSVCEYYQDEMKEYYERQKMMNTKALNDDNEKKVEESVDLLNVIDNENHDGSFIDRMYDSFFNIFVAGRTPHDESTSSTDSTNGGNQVKISPKDYETNQKVSTDENNHEGKYETINGTPDQSTKELLHRITILEEKLGIERTTPKPNKSSTVSDEQNVQKSNIEKRRKAHILTKNKNKVKEEKKITESTNNALINTHESIQERFILIKDKVYEGFKGITEHGASINEDEELDFQTDPGTTERTKHGIGIVTKQNQRIEIDPQARQSIHVSDTEHIPESEDKESRDTTILTDDVIDSTDNRRRWKILKWINSKNSKEKRNEQ
mmetsp:Transcript_8587/g.9909  ORF Transcript_8587/g.9909 Transcript_8587/m.9909 type:complete len:488 (-) Transcript_8587:174-1637(-)